MTQLLERFKLGAQLLLVCPSRSRPLGRAWRCCRGGPRRRGGAELSAKGAGAPAAVRASRPLARAKKPRPPAAPPRCPSLASRSSRGGRVGGREPEASFLLAGSALLCDARVKKRRPPSGSQPASWAALAAPRPAFRSRAGGLSDAAPLEALAWEPLASPRALAGGGGGGGEGQGEASATLEA